MEPPAPLHIIRTHRHPVTAIYIPDGNERVCSGDTSGRVVITSTRSVRPIASWNAHADGILGIQEWGNYVITHGRDNKLSVWNIPEQPTLVGGSASEQNLFTPSLLYSLDVNALNYCAFSLLVISAKESLVALPNLVESAVADIWTLPSCERLHAAVGKADSETERGKSESIGILMSLHLYKESDVLKLLSAYESGTVVLRKYTGDETKSIHGVNWDIVWKLKVHNEAIMSMSVTRDHRMALTVSADHLIGRLDLSTSSHTDVLFVHRTKKPGNSSVAVRDDGRVCAVGGWDGKIRLYSTQSFKRLGTLDYHKGNCQSLAFLHPEVISQEDDDVDPLLRPNRQHWLVSGGKDARTVIWALMSFER